MVERSVWDREVPGSSPGAPIFRGAFLPMLSIKQLALLPVHNIFHTKFKLQKINNNLAVITSAPVKAPFRFDSLVLSISAVLGKDSAILAQAAVKTAKGWGGLYKLFYISQDYKKTFAPQNDEIAKTDIDTLIPKEPAQYFKYQITVLGKAKINLLCAAITQAGAKYDEGLALETLGLRDFDLPVKPIGQKDFKDKTIANRSCSPAAVNAVLNYWNKKTTIPQALKGVYDEAAKIYGTWPLNTAYAAQQGLNAVFVRCSSIAQLEGEVLKGRPVIVSLSFKEGELKNAPSKATAGHLVTVTGFDKNGNIIVMDSAAKTAKEAARVYDRKQFARAWLKNKRGAAYAIEG